MEGFELVDNPAIFQARLQDLFTIKDVISNSSLTIGEWLYSQGYDIVWVNLADIQGYIQDNAEVVKAAVQLVNDIKIANGSSEPNMIMGVSAGGIITKYMLLKAQQTGFNHQCEKFFSYDAPLRGANVPVSIQAFLHHVNYIASTQGTDLLASVPQIAGAFNALTGPFARQTLLYRFYYEPGTNDWVLSSQEHDNFMTELDAMGQLNIRHIALANGSADTPVENNISPGSLMFEAHSLSYIAGIYLNLTPPISMPWSVGIYFDIEGFALSENTGGIVYDGNLKIKIDEIIVKQFPLYIETPENSKTYDTAPGGTSNIGLSQFTGLIGTPMPSIPIPVGFPFLPNGGITVLMPLSPLDLTVYASHFCFIPTRSSLSIGDSNPISGTFSCGQSPANRCTISDTQTPVPAEYGLANNTTEINQEHVFLDARIGDIIVDEMDGANLIPGGILPNSLAAYYNIGLPIQSGIPTITIIGSTGKLSINNSGKVAYATGNEPIAPFTSLVAHTKCEAVISVENGASLVIGADNGFKDGVLQILSGAILHIKSGGTLIVSSNSSYLWIKSGATLIFEAGANVVLKSSESKVLIEGDLQVNGDINYNGDGYFEFGTGNQLVFGTGYNTFNLQGMDKSVRAVKLSSDVVLNQHHRLFWTDLQVEASSGVFKFNNGSGGDFQRCLFTGGTSGGNEIINANYAGNFSATNCDFTNFVNPILGFYSPGIYLNTCNFTNYSYAIIWEGGNVLNAVHCQFDGNGVANGANLKDFWLVNFESCYFNGHQSGYAWNGDDDWLNNTASRAVVLDNISYCLFKNSHLQNNDIGVFNANGMLPGNVFFFHGSTLSENEVGVYMNGDQTKGLVLADCSTWDLNTYGVKGTDVTLMVDSWNSSIYALDEDSPNVFIREPIMPSDIYFNICYDNKSPGSSVLMRNNYWATKYWYNGNWTINADAVPENYIFLMDDLCTTEIAQPNLAPKQDRLPESCALEERPTITFDGHGIESECNVLLIDESGKTVQEQFHEAYYLLKTAQIEDATTAFQPVSDLWSAEMTGLSSNCKQYIAVAKAIVDGAASFDGSEIPIPEERKKEIVIKEKCTIVPNPASDHAIIYMPDEMCSVRVLNQNGRVMKTEDAMTRLNISTVNFPQGLYFIEVLSMDGTWVERKKLVIQK